MGATNNNKPITQIKNSWACNEFRRRHSPVFERSIATNFQNKQIGWKINSTGQIIYSNREYFY
jgi:hypothetical protein